jgi:hypothetical protein
MGNSFTNYGGCGPCFSLSYSNLVHPYCDFYLLGPTDLIPQVSTFEGPIRRPERGGGSEWEPIKNLLEGD